MMRAAERWHHGWMFRVTLVTIALVACGGRSSSPAALAPAEPPPRPEPAPVRAVDPAPVDAARPALAPADCTALRSAPALGVAVVTSRTPDCSGIGHARIVLEVRRLARGSAITRIVTATPLHGEDSQRFAAGAVVVAAIEPAPGAAATVDCVPLPAHEGTLRHAIAVESITAGEHLLDELAAGRACPAPACPMPAAVELRSPTPIPGRKPHPGWYEASKAHGEGLDALAAGDAAAAAAHFMDCGMFAGMLHEHTRNDAVADANAITCFQLAARSFAAAGRFESEGRAALEPHAKGKAPIARAVQALLAAPPADCR